MTRYVNPSTRHDGANQIVVSKRISPADVYEAPFDGQQYVRKDGDWVVGDFSDPSPEWQEWTPVLFSATGGTDPTMGDSSVSGRYRVDGKTVHVVANFVFGSSFSAGSGLYGITLPVAPRGGIWQLLQVAAVIGSERNGYAKIQGTPGIIRIHLLDSGALVALGGSGSSVVIPGSNNRLILSGTYEAA